ncbi:helicase SKI2W [Anthonomus grandis grandis]|uniref:helicase SKI2W n=1 Tax=Anthonomus grandis grandis TaxID=2921223 RepID=UPI0021651013|nr:helicase SKI2W [Anthonomus grandis grandis]
MYHPDLPGIFDDVKVELEKYVLCPENLPIHKYEKNQQFWPREAEILELLHFDEAPVSTTLRVQRDLDTGEIVEFREVSIESVGADASNSMSFTRAPAPPSEMVRGSTSYVPFQPGSFPEPVLDLPKRNTLLDTTELLTVPPGFERGLIFAGDGYTLLEDDGKKSSLGLEEPKSKINLLELIEKEQDFLGEWEIEKKSLANKELKEDTELLPEEEEILPKEPRILNLSSLPPTSLSNTSEWAVLLDPNQPVTDFEKKIPDMAKKFPFELDNFQKLAILQLEKHNHVFVAAHTSAGKTAVAEYAIALSQKHMTRTIYTSPIKALSNQKYRDFKDEFKDVGLITGDFQINQKASCLIMTTEILRSMLYCGSDITRDIEYVIFDEVHYINDRERGHVWEQVLIMLPKEVCVVLLSATVPNTIEFADWLGRTHKRKVYVITTTKRPVPLQHFLYTGRWGGSRHNKFMVLDAEKWLTEGYHKAKAALEPLKDQNTKFMIKQEKTLWSSLVDHLQKFELLPVVAFIFSRQKCDNNADILTNLDLTSQQEKSQIVVFFNKCIRSLKEPDRNIPQIVKMKNILTRGIGVHHSGVLPIVKEIVEMLFQKGLIKILFATETFAMGVNMPARTVIFDSIRKHDGMELRNLLPAEYIQMAGRAGRRGKDERGTVLILCKTSVPREAELKDMMTGRPNKLVSQFRITYGMVLSLLRVESLTVEQMLSKSFGEADHPSHVANWESDLKETERQLEELTKQQLSSYLQPLVQFFECASAYLSIRKEIMPQVLNYPKVQKLLTSGAVILINHQYHINKLALILSKKTSGYRVLILTDSKEPETNKVDLWYQMLALAQEKLFMPSGKLGHQVLTIPPSDIYEITSKTIKIDAKLVESDWEKRQQERFKYDPPGKTCSQAIQELEKLTLQANENQQKLEFQHFIIDLKVNEQSLYHSLETMYRFKDKLIDHLPCTKIPNFEQQFATVFERKFLEEKKKDLEFKLSGASLMLYPDYQNRIMLLRQLGYVDSQNTVKLKGNVARAMGMNELLITELVVDDIFVDLTPAEVAALLSSLVFRVKLRGDQNSYEEELTPRLKEGIRVINQVHHKIANMELELGIQTEEFMNDLNFGLVHVVYRWANAEPFVEIMKLTDIQEGIIVRCIQQLNETIMDVRDAAKIIGNPALQTKMEAASNAIKRDIVFAESLYMQEEKLV